MTPVILLKELKKYIEEAVKDIPLPVKVTRSEKSKERPPKVYLMNLPRKEDEIQQVPYILIKYLTGNDTQEEGDENESEAQVRIIVATYEEDAEEGAVSLLAILSRLRYKFLIDREIAGQFRLIMPVQSIIYPEDTRPYYMGEMMTRWTLPPIEREVKLYDY